VAKLRKILTRRKAVRTLHTVTRTMEMVATARFKRTYNRFLSARSYLDGMAELLEEVLRKSDPARLKHPLLRQGNRKAPWVLLVLTSDRGLCGGYNNAVLTIARARREELIREKRTVQLHVVGKRGLSQLRHEGSSVDRVYESLDGSAQSWHAVSQLADSFLQDYLGRALSGLDVVHSDLVGSAGHRPTILRLLPMRVVEEKQPAEETFEDDAWEPWEPLLKPELEYEFVPSTETVFHRLLPMTFRLRLYRCFMASAVTEQIARMTAMRAANDNAEEMLRALTIRYNRTRQAQITTELAEILGGRAALQ
jgi:F-type H+-transporting ATPase subunit gamma